MTALAARPAALATATRSPAFVAGMVALVAGTVALRLWHQTAAYDVFVDEIQYADVGSSFAAGHGPELFGAPFFLHPPLFFVVVGWALGHPYGARVPDTVLDLRWVELPFAAVNVALVMVIAGKLGGRRAALLAGACYALDPFVIRFDSRLMLECPSMTCVLAGFAAAIVATQDRDGARRRVWLVVAGLCFGVGLITKTTSALVTSVPLLLMLATGWGVRRREAVGMLGMQVAVYAAYLVWVLASGHAGPWFDQTLSGVFRASGVKTETGFNSAAAPSFSSRLLANLSLFAPSYLLMALGAGFACYLFVTGWRSLGSRTEHGTHTRVYADGPARWLVCWFAGVGFAIVYTFGFGEIEEQTFYLLCVPSAIMVGVLASTLSRSSRLWRALTVGVVAVGLAGAAAVWVRVHTVPDDSYRRLHAYLTAHVAPGSQLALGEHTAQFVLPGYGFHALPSVAAARADGARYALVSTQLTALGLAPTPQPVLDDLAAHDTPVFSFAGRTVGSLILYDLEAPR